VIPASPVPVVKEIIIQNRPKTTPALPIYFDIESTGLSTMDDQIVEIAFVCGVKKYHSYVRSERKMCFESRKVTGIEEATLDEKGKPIAQVLQEIVDFLKTLPAPRRLVAYNGFNFDFPLLLSEFWRWDFKLAELPIEELGDAYRWAVGLPTHRLLRRKGQPDYRQGSIFKSFFKESLDDAHSALADTEGLKRICEDSRMIQFAQCDMTYGDYLKGFTSERKMKDLEDYPHKKRKRSVITNFFTKPPKAKRQKT